MDYTCIDQLLVPDSTEAVKDTKIKSSAPIFQEMGGILIKKKKLKREDTPDLKNPLHWQGKQHIQREAASARHIL